MSRGSFTVNIPRVYFTTYPLGSFAIVFTDPVVLLLLYGRSKRTITRSRKVVGLGDDFHLSPPFPLSVSLS
jgi:hypothetical protein